MFPTLPVERKQEEALERIERNSIDYYIYFLTATAGS
jgi:hypothetical protein